MKHPHSIINQYKHISDTSIVAKGQINPPTELIQLSIHRQDIFKNFTRCQMEPSFLEIYFTYAPRKVTATLMQCTSSE